MTFDSPLWITVLKKQSKIDLVKSIIFFCKFMLNIDYIERHKIT